MGALENIRILDLSTMLSGPFGAMMLADLGAEVIKIETPDGDGTRNFPPHIHKGTSMYFMAYNRNKKSVVINLKDAEGKKVFYDLVKQADIVWDNFRPGIREKLGIDYKTLRQLNPKIICASITGFGNGNQYGNRPSYDLCVQAISGVLSMTGEPGRSPVKLGVPMADLGGGWYCVVGVLAALLERARTGEGQEVDISMLDSLTSLHGYEAVYYLYSGIVPEPLGTSHRNNVPYQIFKTKDIYIAIVVALDKFWTALCKALDISEHTRQKYATIQLRYDHRDEVIALLEEIFPTKTASEWLNRLDAEGVPCGAVNPMDRALEEPALLQRNMIVDVEHKGDTIRLLGNPVKLSNSSERYKCPPELGQDTDDVLREVLRYSDDDISKLKNIGAIN
ncbi:CoA transferase [Synergistales bacterium]|nr:CoA transferase [Synergistales bacterium]